MADAVAWVRIDLSGNGSPAIRLYSDSVFGPVAEALDVEAFDLGMRGKAMAWARWLTTRSGPLGPVNRVGIGAIRARVIVADHINASDAAMRALGRQSETHLVYIAHNVETENRRRVAASTTGLRRLARRFDARNARLLEDRVLARASLVVALTPADAAELRHRTDADIVVVPPATPPRPAVDQQPDLAIGICGSTGWSIKRRSQEELIDALSPLLREGRRLVVFGKHNPEWIRAMSASYPGIEFAGWVPDLAEGLQRVSVVAVHEPNGGGFQLRLLDALAADRPVIGTIESLRALASPASYSLAVNSVPELAALARRVLDDPDLRSRSGREFAQQLAWIDHREEGIAEIITRIEALLRSPRP